MKRKTAPEIKFQITHFDFLITRFVFPLEGRSAPEIKFHITHFDMCYSLFCELANDAFDTQVNST